MTREQFDRLLSSYSSGKISPEEKDILFRASLENQEFFDALADEETLREVMADPACRAELEEILEPQPVLAQAAAAAPMFTRNKQDAGKETPKKELKRVFSFRPWVLALAGTLGSAIIGTFIAWRNQKPAPLPPAPSSETAVMVAQNDPLKSIPPVPSPSFAPPQAKQQEKKDEASTTLAEKSPESVPAAAPAVPEDKEKKSGAADTVAEAKRSGSVTESVEVQETPATVGGPLPQHRQRITSESVRVGSGVGFSALANRADSIPRFTTKVSDGKITLEVVQEGLLYVLAVDEGNFRIIENGTRVNAGATRIIDPGTSRQLLIAITDRSIDDPNPVRLRLAAPTKIITIP